MPVQGSLTLMTLHALSGWRSFDLHQAGCLIRHVVRCAAGELYDIIDAYQPPAYHEMDATTLHSTLAVSGRCSALITVSGAWLCQHKLKDLYAQSAQVRGVYSTLPVLGQGSPLTTV